MANSPLDLIEPGDLYEMQWAEDLGVAPDGSAVALALTRIDRGAQDYVAQLLLVPTDGGAPRVLATAPGRIRNPRWSPDGQRVAFVSSSSGHAEVWLADVRSGCSRQLTHTPVCALDPHWSPDGRKIACIVEVPDPQPSFSGPVTPPRVIRRLDYRVHLVGYRAGYRHLAVVDAESGDLSVITSGDWDDNWPAWSPDGKHLAFVSNRTAERPYNNRADIYLMSVDGRELRQLTDSRGPIVGLSLSPDGEEIAYLGHSSPPETGYNTNYAVQVIRVADGTTRCLSASFDRSATAELMTDMGDPDIHYPATWSGDGKGIYFLASDRGNISLFRAERNGQDVRPIVAGERKLIRYAVASRSPQVALIASDPTHIGDLFVASVPGGRERQLTHLNAALEERCRLVSPEPLPVRNPHGLDLDTWVLKPPKMMAGHRCPLILEVHGGPHLHFGNAFFHEFQILAAQGYVVVYSNPRGSLGRGQAFTNSIRGHWGEVEFEDLMAVVDQAITLPYVDPGRVGIVGGSYGGFLTLWMISHTDRFKVAVADRGIADCFSRTLTNPNTFPLFEWEFGGVPQDLAERYLAHSPVMYARHINTPLLLMHAEQDWQCPIGGSEEMFASLKRFGRTVEYVRYPDAGHGMSRSGPPPYRLDRLSRIVAWLGTYLPPEPRPQ